MKLRWQAVHIWYHLDLDVDFTPVPLGCGVSMVRACECDLHLLDQLSSGRRRRARRRLHRGSELWIVHEGGQAAFACWVVHGPIGPVPARGRMAGLEDPVIAPAFRDRAMAPAAWSAVAGALRVRDIKLIVTKVDEADLVSRRAAERIGFRAVASVQWSRIGGQPRIAYLGVQ